MKLLKIGVFILFVILLIVPLVDAASYSRVPRVYSNPIYAGAVETVEEPCEYEIKSSRWGSISQGYCQKRAQTSGLTEEEIGYGMGYRSYYSRTITITDSAQAPFFYASPYVIIIK